MGRSSLSVYSTWFLLTPLSFIFLSQLQDLVSPCNLSLEPIGEEVKPPPMIAAALPHLKHRWKGNPRTWPWFLLRWVACRPRGWQASAWAWATLSPSGISFPPRFNHLLNHLARLTSLQYLGAMTSLWGSFDQISRLDIYFTLSTKLLEAREVWLLIIASCDLAHNVTIHSSNLRQWGRPTSTFSGGWICCRCLDWSYYRYWYAKLFWQEPNV